MLNFSLMDTRYLSGWLILLAVLTVFQNGQAQTNVVLTNAVGQQVLLGNYNPAAYTPSTVISDREAIVQGIVDEVSADSLKAYLEVLETFQTRNTGSDTVSSVRGIGAARRWIKAKFDEFSQDHENRLITGYLRFDLNICGMTQHRNVFAILPGLDTSRKDILLVEAHFDTRCEDRCDTACLANGAEDNGSGTALVMELARVMSKYAFDRTIVFTPVTGEEQGLNGGDAWAGYIKDRNIPFMACLNNDVIGGVYCGETSSPPSCPIPNEVDSMNVRIFSYSPLNDSNFVSPHKQLARYVKLQLIEEINPRIAYPMNINMMIREDRVGRGGDHIPFREKGLTALRFTSQNEHGDGSGSFPDRQHSTRDVLGIDTDNDLVLDSFFVDFNYLARNTMINGVNLALLSNSPPAPQPPQVVEVPGGVDIYVDPADQGYAEHRVGVRRHGSGSLYFDRVETYSGTNKLYVPGLLPGETYALSLMNVDGEGIESLFTEETESLVTGGEEALPHQLELFKIRPNPATDQAELVIKATKWTGPANAQLVLTDLSGKVVKETAIAMRPGVQRITVGLESLAPGTYFYALRQDGSMLVTNKLVVSR